MKENIGEFIFTHGKDILTSILTIWGLVIASKGLSTWKKQIKGSKYFETSYNLNYSVLKLRAAIKSVRNPAIWPAETYAASKYFKNKYPDKVEAGDSNPNSNGYVYEMRWEEISTAYTELESHLLAAELLWGREILEKIKPLRKKVSKLNISLKHYFDPNLRELKNREELFDIIYDQSSEDEEDKFSKEVSFAVQEISSYLKAKI